MLERVLLRGFHGVRARQTLSGDLEIAEAWLKLADAAAKEKTAPDKPE
jgi:hypothetical protein